MTEYGIIKLSRAAAIEACCKEGLVYQINLDDLNVSEIRYMTIEDIMEIDRCHTVIYFEVVPDEN